MGSRNPDTSSCSASEDEPISGYEDSSPGSIVGSAKDSLESSEQSSTSQPSQSSEGEMSAVDEELNKRDSRKKSQKPNQKHRSCYQGVQPKKHGNRMSTTAFWGAKDKRKKQLNKTLCKEILESVELKELVGKYVAKKKRKRQRQRTWN